MMIHRPRSLVFLAAALTLIACGDKTPTAITTVSQAHPITSATLDSLPIITLADGGLLCTGDPLKRCPAGGAVANWLAPDRFALWEPGRPVAVWTIGDTVAIPVGNFGQGAGEYTNPAAVSTTEGGDFLVIDAAALTLLRYDGRGKFIDSKALGRFDNGMVAWGFSGRLPVAQRIWARSPIAPAELELRILKAAGDTAGRLAISHPLPWLHIKGDVVEGAMPLFPIQPVYAVAEDGSVLWSAGEQFQLNLLNPAGVTVWAITSDIAGTPIDSADIAARKKMLADAAVSQADIDSMAALTPRTLAAISGIVLARDGRALVARSVVPSRDSIDFVLISKDGLPTARLTLEKRVRPLLLTGDSLLVQRPSMGEPLEVRWMTIPKGP